VDRKGELFLQDEEVLYRALTERDGSFEGIFWAGITTTGIFCRPGCPARKPNRENVRFFSSPREALMAGYRPCKLCHPMGEKGALPDWLRPLMEEVDGDPGIPLKDRDLRERGLDPARVRRWFKKHHGMTFQTYLRTLRIGRAYGRIRHEGEVTPAAFDSGFESLSGFSGAFRKKTGFAPGKSSGERVVMVTRIPTPLGPMLAGAVEEGICLLEFVDRRMIETQIERLRRYLRAEFLPGESPHFLPLARQLKEYFAGTRREFDLPLVVPGTPFQKQVWEELRRIPYGETLSYARQARNMGNPKAVRAVATANGDNRLAILIPCHRVIGSDGSLTGYGGGLHRKRFLLDLEASGG